MSLTEHLRNGQQCDEDGVMCIVSHQACHEAADELTRLRAENERLRAGIQAVLDGDPQTQPCTTPWSKDGSPSKHDQCVHGRWMYEGCEACTGNFLQNVLDGKWPDQ